jgi:hypothetical protein
MTLLTYLTIYKPCLIYNFFKKCKNKIEQAALYGPG